MDSLAEISVSISLFLENSRRNTGLRGSGSLLQKRPKPSTVLNYYSFFKAITFALEVQPLSIVRIRRSIEI